MQILSFLKVIRLELHKILIKYLITCKLATYHAMDKNAEGDPKYQGENQDGTYDVVRQKLPCEQFQTVNVLIKYFRHSTLNALRILPLCQMPQTAGQVVIILRRSSAVSVSPMLAWATSPNHRCSSRHSPDILAEKNR